MPTLALYMQFVGRNLDYYFGEVSAFWSRICISNGYHLMRSRGSAESGAKYVVLSAFERLYRHEIYLETRLSIWASQKLEMDA